MGLVDGTTLGGSDGVPSQKREGFVQGEDHTDSHLGLCRKTSFRELPQVLSVPSCVQREGPPFLHRELVLGP